MQDDGLNKPIPQDVPDNAPKPAVPQLADVIQPKATFVMQEGKTEKRKKLFKIIVTSLSVLVIVAVAIIATFIFNSSKAEDCSGLPGDKGAWIYVPGNPTYNQKGFCVMKYDAKEGDSSHAISTASGLPWVNISQAKAEQISDNSCKGCHLITNNEWMTIAANIASQSANWCNADGTGCGNKPGTPGKQLSNGDSDRSDDGVTLAGLSASSNDSYGCYHTNGSQDANDNNTDKPTLDINESGTVCNGGQGQQKRTFTLSNGNIIWDFAGNVMEWSQGSISSAMILKNTGSSCYSTDNHSEFNSWFPYKVSLPGTIDGVSTAKWGEANGLGDILYCSGKVSIPTYGILRGGYWGYGTKSGIFSVFLITDPGAEIPSGGFRVAVER